MTPEPPQRINDQFLEAVIANDVMRAVELLGSGAQVDVKSEDGRTALMIVSGNGNMDLALALLDSGADVEAQDKSGWTALMYAARNGHVNVAAALLRKGANLEAKSTGGLTALMCAAENQDSALLLEIIANGANLNSRNNLGQTALMNSSARGHVDVALALLEKGADLDAKDKNGCTALMLASSHGSAGVALVLMEKGADIEAQDHHGQTALIYAENLALALKLIAYGADSKKLERRHEFHGFTPLQASAAGGFLPRLQALLGENVPRPLAFDEPKALLQLAKKYKQSDAAAVIESHLAARAIAEITTDSFVSASKKSKSARL